MKMLAIDPSSDDHDTSTCGIVLLDNAKLVDYWVVDQGSLGLKNWWYIVGKELEFDTCVYEKFELRNGSSSSDNSVLRVIEEILRHIPNAIAQRNAGYATDIPNDLLKGLGMWKFKKSHHQDVRAAARLGLFWAMRNDIQEVVDDIGTQLERSLEDAKAKKVATKGS